MFPTMSDTMNGKNLTSDNCANNTNRDLRNFDNIPDVTADRNLRHDGMTKTGQSGAILPPTGGERYQVGFGDNKRSFETAGGYNATL